MYSITKNYIKLALRIHMKRKVDIGCLVIYYLSAYLAKAFFGVTVLVTNWVLRVSINLCFSALTILLIASNL